MERRSGYIITGRFYLFSRKSEQRKIEAETLAAAGVTVQWCARSDDGSHRSININQGGRRMNKLEKILAQSVTPEMVAEQLTEQEIEEVIEEYELKIESSKEFFDTAEQRAAEYEQKAILCQRFASDWRKTANEEKEKIKTWRSVVEKAKQALKRDAKFAVGDTVVFTKSEKGLFSIGDIGVVKKSLKAYGRYTYHVETPSCAFVVAEEHEIELHENELSPNKRRAELIDEAKRFVETNTKKRKIFTSVGNWYAFEYYGRSVNERFVISESKRTIKLEIVGAINPVVYKEGVVRCHLDDVWNEHIGKAIALGRILGVDISKFESAPQPAEIVEGMDVEFLSASRGLYKRGRVKEYNEKDDYVILEDGYELGEGAKPNNVVLIASSNYRILSDTKAKYSDGDE